MPEHFVTPLYKQAIKLRGEDGHKSILSSPSALDGLGVESHAPAVLAPRNRPDTNSNGDCLGNRADLDGRRKVFPLGSELRKIYLE